MTELDFTIASDPKRLSSQIEFVELMIEKDSQRLEELNDDKDIELVNYVLRMSNEILKSLKLLQRKNVLEDIANDNI